MIKNIEHVKLLLHRIVSMCNTKMYMYIASYSVIFTV